jgi:hypothetical protein
LEKKSIGYWLNKFNLVNRVVDTQPKRTYTNSTVEMNDSDQPTTRRKESMKRFNPKTKTYKVFNALYNGEALTPAQAKKLGVGNLAAEASRIRQSGYAVYANSRTAANGVKVTEYVMGKPSREIVALGYAAKAAGLTLDTI